MNTTPTVDLPTPDRVLAIGAHPDDIEFGCGATLAKWSAAGSAVHLLVLTDGSKGTWDAGADTALLVSTREGEQRAAAHALGAVDVHFARFVDGELDSTLAARRDVCAFIRSVRPDVVLGHDPWKRYRIHPDHRHAGLLAIEGIVAARDPHFFADLDLAPHRPGIALLFEAEVVDHYERVDEPAFEAKIAALLCHRSQWQSTHGIDLDPPTQLESFRERLLTELRVAGDRVEHGMAEQFKRLDDL